MIASRGVRIGAVSAALLLVPAMPGLAPWAAAQDTLVTAAERGETLVVRRLLAEGVEVDTRDGRGRTALLAATHRNQIEVARLLINEGADVDAKDFIQDSPFLLAGAEGRTEILQLILKAQPDLESVNRFGGTALIPACHYGHVETVRLLLTTAINKDHVNNLGWTALLEAVILGDGRARYVEIVRLLVAAGADIGIPDRDGVTALDHARRRGYSRIVSILEAAGAR